MAFSTPLENIQVKDNNTYAIKPSKNINGYFLAAGTAKTITFPADAVPAKPNYAIFAANGIFYARWDGSAATIPVADTSDSAGSEAAPGARVIEGLTTVSVIAPVDTVLTIAYYF